MDVFEKIKKILDEKKLKYSVKVHEPVYTSKQAAKVRGDKLKQGAKAIIMKTAKGFVLVVLSAERKIDSKKLRKVLDSKKISFANLEELKIFALVPGSVPPFGSVLGLKTYVDKSLLENKEISFNAGSLTNSIMLNLKDYLAVENPIIEDFS
jgi:Ala-tRNA(Pro) deacylase